MLKKLFDSSFVYYIPVWIVLSVLGCAGTFYLADLSNAAVFRSPVAFKVIVAILIATFLFITVLDWSKIKDTKKRIRRITYSFIFSFFLALSYIWGYQLTSNGITDLGVKGKLFTFLASGGVALGMMSMANLWFALMDKMKSAKAKNTAQKGNLKWFFMSFGIILVCWIPVFLAYYPAIMSYDFHKQSQEAYQGWIWFNAHHPLIHTALIRWFFLLGEAIGSYQLGIAFFSILQMLVLSSVYAYSCTMIFRLTGKKWPFWVATAWFAILPFHPVMALSMTKDTLFTAFVLLLVVLFLEYRMAETKKKRIFLYIALILTGILVMIFRNNAVYAFVVFTFFYAFWSQKQRLQIILLCIAIIIGGHVTKTTMQAAMQAGDGNSIEMYSVPLQQLCRVGANHYGFLTNDQYALLNYYINEEAWHKYNPYIADGVKASAAVYTYETWKNDIPAFIKTWAEFGLAFPNDYLDAFLVLTQGYWFIDDMSHAELLGYGDDSNLGLLYTFNASASHVFEGIETHSYLPGILEQYQKIVNGNSYKDWPVLYLLFKPAFYMWLLVLCMVSLLYVKDRNKLVLCAFPFIYFLTLLLGPVVNFRYAYPIIVTIPLLISWLFTHKNWYNIYHSLPKQGKDKNGKKHTKNQSAK